MYPSSGAGEKPSAFICGAASASRPGVTSRAIQLEIAARIALRSAGAASCAPSRATAPPPNGTAATRSSAVAAARRSGTKERIDLGGQCGIVRQLEGEGGRRRDHRAAANAAVGAERHRAAGKRIDRAREEQVLDAEDAGSERLGRVA